MAREETRFLRRAEKPGFSGLKLEEIVLLILIVVYH
jgi:hypothetical protein